MSGTKRSVGGAASPGERRQSPGCAYRGSFWAGAAPDGSACSTRNHHRRTENGARTKVRRPTGGREIAMSSDGGGREDMSVDDRRFRVRHALVTRRSCLTPASATSSARTSATARSTLRPRADGLRPPRISGHPEHDGISDQRTGMAARTPGYLAGAGPHGAVEKVGVLVLAFGPKARDDRHGGKQGRDPRQPGMTDPVQMRERPMDAEERERLVSRGAPADVVVSPPASRRDTDDRDAGDRREPSGGDARRRGHPGAIAGEGDASRLQSTRGSWRCG